MEDQKEKEGVSKEEENQALNESQAQIEALKEELKVKNEQLKGLESNNNEQLKSALANAEEKLKGVEKSLEDKEQEMKLMEQKFNAEKMEFEDLLTSSIAKVEKDQKAAMEALNVKLNEKSTELTSIKEKFKEAEELCSRTSEALNEEKASNKVLEDQLASKRRELEQTATELNDALSSLQMTKDENRKLSSNLQIQENKISDLTKKIEQSDKEKNEQLVILEEARSEISAMKANVTTLEEQLNAKSAEIKALQANTKSDDTEKDRHQQSVNDAMSTSTISKADEAGRLHELDSCFEERYNKLKHLTIQFKKKAVEQEKIAVDLKEKLAKASDDYNCLQKYCDDQTDLLDETKKELKTVKQQLESSSCDFETLKQTLEERQKQLLSLQEEKDQLEIDNKHFKGELEQKSLTMATLMTTAEENGKEIERLTKCLEQTKNELSSSSAISKKHDLLDMELESAERRVEELSQRNDEQEREIKELTENNGRLESLLKDRESLIRELEQAVEREAQRHQDTKSKLQESRSESSQLEVSCSELKAECSLLTSKLESLQRDQSETSRKWSESNNSALVAKEALERKNESMQKMIKVLEQELDQRRGEKEQIEAKFNGLEKEFEAYRVRATSVLKKSEQQTSHSALMHSQGTELAVLERSVQDLNSKIASLTSSLGSTENELQELQSEHDRLMQRHSSLLQELAAKEIASRKKQEQLVALTKDAEMARQQLAKQLEESRSGLKAQYEARMEETKAAHAALVNSLQRQVDERDNQILRLQQQQQQQQQLLTKSGPEPVERSVKSPSPYFTEREAAEGSDSVKVSSREASPFVATSPMPLDQLLGTSDAELSNVKPKDEGLQRRISHLSALLCESENENARLKQLSQVLKEEIRVYQRSEERQRHLEHLEYLKNVIIKFVTLDKSDEKERLLPVLTTMLRLKEEEVAMLRKVATQGEVEPESESAGWSNYLGLWST